MTVSLTVEHGRPIWFGQAACTGVDPNVFFPDKGESTDKAKSICGGCDVREPCLEFGMGELAGVWGGTSPTERRRIRLARRRRAA